MEYKYINVEYLDSVTGGDPDITREIVNMFNEQVTEAYAEMLKLNTSGDYHNLGQLAHKVKSSAAIMGMTELALMLKTFELQTRERLETDRYPAYIERFRSDTAAAVAELEDMIRSRYK
jgi:HPt (histidine-containing phosphotransfer) domain-containing protein